ncbi:toxin-antitoxin system HicB family antitoxin [Oenococcus alcoholitolerans]|uniref:Pilus biosynthesis protein HicB n=1 Tax=Oenococcus alcoholitolerans TaxID=931074 RepID=A0ABR4XR42_9LACO|nr:pilus biosynthesis protein HicB [Oenococcus alcoholitolerans]
MVNKKSGKIALRIEPELHEKISELAKSDNRSLNSYIAKVLEEKVESSSFENRQFVGTSVDASKIDEKNGLVDVSGIYYRYIIAGDEKIEKRAKYVILSANGNLLTLSRLKEK